MIYYFIHYNCVAQIIVQDCQLLLPGWCIVPYIKPTKNKYIDDDDDDDGGGGGGDEDDDDDDDDNGDDDDDHE